MVVTFIQSDVKRKAMGKWCVEDILYNNRYGNVTK